MRTNSINNRNITFKSRNPEIRFADDIARKVNREFPRISTSRMKKFKNVTLILGFSDFLIRINDKLGCMRSAKRSEFKKASSFEQALRAVTSNIKKAKIGNCSESAQLSEIVARVNGIDDCYCAKVTGGKGYFSYDLDHAVLFVKNNNKPYIIDAWLGFADYLPEASEKYLRDYNQYFDFYKCKNEKVYFDEPVTFDPTGEIFSKKYSNEELRKLYPELIIKRN